MDKVGLSSIDQLYSTSSLEKALMNITEIWDKEKENEIEACFRHLGSSKPISNEYIPLKELIGDAHIDKPKVELKVFPSHLKYVFYGENKSKLVTIISSLSEE